MGLIVAEVFEVFKGSYTSEVIINSTSLEDGNTL